MVNNSPFEVGITYFSTIGPRHKYYKYFTGEVTESGKKLSTHFGISKATKYFDIALEFLQFLTSYEINQLVMSYPKWGPVVKFEEYKGKIFKKMAPILGGNPLMWPQWRGGWGDTVERNVFEIIEEIIINKIDNPIDYFIKKYNTKVYPLLLHSIQENCIANQRAYLKMEMQRSQFSLGLMRENILEKETKNLQLRKDTAIESYTQKIGRILTD